MRNFLREFETFVVRGNAIDLAVGVVIGAAFGQITATLSSGVLTPVVGFFLGGFDFAKLALPLGGDAVIAYGAFLQAILNFILIAFALFLLMKLLNRIVRKRKAEEKKPAENPELKVLLEIRDALNARG